MQERSTTYSPPPPQFDPGFTPRFWPWRPKLSAWEILTCQEGSLKSPAWRGSTRPCSTCTVPAWNWASVTSLDREKLQLQCQHLETLSLSAFSVNPYSGPDQLALFVPISTIRTPPLRTGELACRPGPSGAIKRTPSTPTSTTMSALALKAEKGRLVESQCIINDKTRAEFICMMMRNICWILQNPPWVSLVVWDGVPKGT